MEINIIGLDLAKNVFHMHGADASGAGPFQQAASPKQGARVLRKAVTLYCRHGSLWWSTLLGARNRKTRSHSSPDSA